MKDQIEQRLTELRSEFEAGQQMLTDLATREANIRQSMLRISGAIQALEELLERSETDEPALAAGAAV
jgi:hypothetical protein